MSSQDILDRDFPIVCERCGRRAAMPTADTTQTNENRLQIAVRCGECQHGWIVYEPNAPFKIRRKRDRRAVPRDN
jgi:ribosomal protein S27E